MLTGIEIVVDTETTGLSPADGHRIVEVGAVELRDGVPTGRTFYRYVNPERSMPKDAFAVHKLGDVFLKSKPLFAAIADDLLAFLGAAPLVMHNAAFDLGFLNAELSRCGREIIDEARATCTVKLVRAKYPGQKANLDALCKRFDVKGERKVHGALKDAWLLAEVYLAMHGGRQGALGVAVEQKREPLAGITPAQWVPLLVQPSEAETTAWKKFVEGIQDAIWMAI